MFKHQAQAAAQFAALFAAGSLLASSLAMAADRRPSKQETTKASTIVTVLPKGDAPATVTAQDLHLKVNGKEAPITGFTPLHNPQDNVEVVLLIDNGARTTLGTQMGDITNFVMSQPPETKLAIAYMYGGEAQLGGPLTTDHNAVLRTLHLPEHGGAAISASPYFCVSDLAQHWPSNDAHARRIVIMISDGVDYYEMHYDPEDPYVQSAMNDAARAHLIVYAIYWRSVDLYDRTNYGTYDGQNLLAELTESTGGESYWEGMGNPVSFQPYFKEIDKRLENQYQLDFMSSIGAKPELQTIRLQVRARVKVTAPQMVFVYPPTN